MHSTGHCIEIADNLILRKYNILYDQFAFEMRTFQRLHLKVTWDRKFSMYMIVLHLTALKGAMRPLFFNVKRLNTSDTIFFLKRIIHPACSLLL